MEDNRVTDQSLDSYLAAPAGNDSDELGELLAARAEPIVRKVVFRRIGESRSDAEDVCGDAMLSLVQHLQRYKEDQEGRSIEDFGSYAAATAHHACDQYLRRKHPALWRFRNRVRYLLEHNERLAVWRNSQGVALCGLAIYKGEEHPGKTPEHFVPSNPSVLRIFLFELLRESMGPVELHEAVCVAWSLSGLATSVAEQIDPVEVVESRPAADRKWEQRTYAAALWKEIQELPYGQRCALLLNLKNDAMNLLLFTGTASLRQIAATVELPAEELASVWHRLPFVDADIAVRLGCTRQQVINLRMAARKRLANRLAGWR